MLKTRIITAIIALILLAVLFQFSNPSVIKVFFTILVGVGTREILSMILPGVYRLLNLDRSVTEPVWLRSILMFIACCMFWGMVSWEGASGSVAVIGTLVALVLGVFLADSVDLSFGYSAGLVLSLVYGVFPWVAIWNLYDLQVDLRYIYFMCAIVWAGDTGAYFVGRRFGRSKLSPKLSPNKTWEGSYGGIIASLFAASIVKTMFGDDFAGWTAVVACGIFGGAFGQLGDLTESAYKRFAGIKDSGRLFPGHGGFLDRVDGLLFAAPVIWLILYRFGV